MNEEVHRQEVWEFWRQIAQVEVADLLASLPDDVRARAEEIPVTLELCPNPSMLNSGIKPNTLGLFIGTPFSSSACFSAPIPPQIILFVEVILRVTGPHVPAFREQVRRTFLHEVGHYLGLNEKEVRRRNL